MVKPKNSSRVELRDAKSLRERLAAHLGPDRYRVLLHSVGPTRARGRLLFWQEDLFRRSAAETGIAVHTFEEFLQFFADINDVSTRPARISEDDWIEVAAWNEQQALIGDAAMREAQTLHEQAMCVAVEAESATRNGDTEKAQALIRKAFDLQRRAAERC